MTVQTLYTAATGMEALETKLDVIANNMANINTTGFKKDRANFEDVFYRQYRLPGATDGDGNITSTGIEVGLGTRISSTQSNHEQGAFETTSNQLDIAIEGDGFFQVQNPSGGQPLYTRAGNFGLNADGNIVLGSANNGYLLEPPVNIQPDATDIVITSDGQVQIRTQDSTDLQTVAQLQLAKFVNPDGLLKLGDNLYQQTDASGDPQVGDPGQLGFGNIRQGFLEASNVEPVTELIDLITTQRAFELNSQVVQAGDQIMQIVANLRRLA
jgi:flagellar basal-body rod protein FlgG